MSEKVSTGLRNKMLDTGSLKAAMDLGFILIYGGTPPVTADAAATGTLLCTISVNKTGVGLTMAAAAVDGTLVKNTSEIWKGTNVANGTATHYRHVAAGDTGASSTTEARLQGTVDTAGADLNLTSTVLASGADQSIDYYSINFPTL